MLILPGYQFTRVPDRAARSRGRDHQACCSFCSHGADAAAVGQIGVGPLWRAVVRAAVTTQVVVRVDALRLVFVDSARVLPVLLLFHTQPHVLVPCRLEPRCFSLVLQPLILSPSINIGDVAVQLARLHARTPPSVPRDDTFLLTAVHTAHPFPVLERYATEDLHLDDAASGSPPAVKAGTQVRQATWRGGNPG